MRKYWPAKFLMGVLKFVGSFALNSFIKKKCPIDLQPARSQSLTTTNHKNLAQQNQKLILMFQHIEFVFANGRLLSHITFCMIICNW